MQAGSILYEDGKISNALATSKREFTMVKLIEVKLQDVCCKECQIVAANITLVAFPLTLKVLSNLRIKE